MHHHQISVNLASELSPQSSTNNNKQTNKQTEETFTMVLGLDGISLTFVALTDFLSSSAFFYNKYSLH